MKWFWIILIEMVVYLTILNIVKITGVSIGSAFCIGYLTSGIWKFPGQGSNPAAVPLDP